MGGFRWSYTSASSFEQCKYMFYLKYVLRDYDAYCPEDNFYAEVGRLCHEVLAKVFRGELSEDDAPARFMEGYDSGVFHRTRENVMDSVYEKCADYFASMSTAGLGRYDVLGVEMKVESRIRGLDFVGYIDLLIREKGGGRIILVDHKSAGYPFGKSGGILRAQREKFESSKRQMSLYAHCVREMLGSYPDELAWNHFKDGMVARVPFSEADCRAGEEWLAGVADAAAREEEFAPSCDFFFCREICEFRGSCEYAALGGRWDGGL